MAVHKILDLSTAHITQNTAAVLDRWTEYWRRQHRASLGLETPPDPAAMSPIITYPKDGFGWFIHAQQDRESLQEDIGDIPADLLALLYHALALDCHWISLDSGAPEIDLPTYEW